jgi:PTH1 family peptidyl-tRNA hydrolase
MLLIVGLGNPGRRYAGNRHNVGFMAADEIHRRHRFSAWRARFQGEISEGTLDGEKVIILKPATYMNESGRSVGEAARFYKLDADDIVVIYDELDLPPGKIRMKTGGSPGGHNGLKSLDAHLGSTVGKNYRRIRVGIGHPGRKELVNGHVLHDFAKADQDWLQPLLTAIAENAGLLATSEDSSFMNRIHLATRSEETPPAEQKAKQPESRQKTSEAPKTGLPEGERKKGPLAEGLRRLFGGKNE